jgi:hypothetical protein
MRIDKRNSSKSAVKKKRDRLLAAWKILTTTLFCLPNGSKTKQNLVLQTLV